MPLERDSLNVCVRSRTCVAFKGKEQNQGPPKKQFFLHSYDAAIHSLSVTLQHITQSSFVVNTAFPMGRNSLMLKLNFAPTENSGRRPLLLSNSFRFELNLKTASNETESAKLDFSESMNSVLTWFPKPFAFTQQFARLVIREAPPGFTK